MKYQDFTIFIQSAAEERFEAIVVEAPFRENPRVLFSAPMEKQGLQALLEASDKVVQAAVDSPEGRNGRESVSVPSPQVVGQKLFSSIFQGELIDLFERCRAALARDRRSGLRLRLKFLFGDTEAEYLAALPWEWLWDPRTASFLATGRSTPVVRDFATPFWHGRLKVHPPLRILLVEATPGTMKSLDLTLETERMFEALEPLIQEGQVVLLQLEASTPEALRDILLSKEIHILHFMGHGGYDPESGTGAVFFVRPDGSADQVDGEELAGYPKDIPSLRLVALNSCKTARHAGYSRARLNYGVASAILGQSGVPAVLANQYSISDKAAISFSETFYGRIAAGDDVDAALAETRLRLKRHSCEWGTPVLFLTAPNGKIFGFPPAKRRSVARILAPSRVAAVRSGSKRRSIIREFEPARVAAEPVRLGVRSFEGWGGDMEVRNDAVLDLVAFFENRFIRKPEWWQEIIFPQLREFLLTSIDPRRPVLLDFAAHSSIAFASGWILEVKSGLDVRVLQRTGKVGKLPWSSPSDDSEPEGHLWLERPDINVVPGGLDVALSLAVSQPAVAEHVEKFVQTEGLPVGRIIDATIAPAPGARSVRGGAHALRLAQALLPSLRQRYPHERKGRLHLFCAGPNALLFYLGQLSRSLERIALYEFAFEASGGGRYQQSIELPPPGERLAIPWEVW